MSNFQATEFRSPIGRFVWGSLYEPNTEDFDGNPLVIKNGPDKGKPTQAYEFGLAVPKGSPTEHWASTPFGAIIWAQGFRDHPASANASLTDPSAFSWKVTDGDSAKPGKPYKGKPGRAPKDKPGFPGHWVYTFRGSYEPKIVNHDGSKYLLDKNVVMPGDCIQVAGKVVGNEGASPGVYLNYDAISFQGGHRDGRLSVGGIDPTKVGFGSDPRPSWVTDQVASAAVTGAPPPPSGPQPPPAPPPGYSPTPPPPAQQQVPQVPVHPAPQFIQPPPPPPAGTASPPPPPTGPQMTPAAGGHTYQSFIAAGWKDADLRAKGYML